MLAMPHLRIKDAAAYLGVSDDTVRRWVDRGLLHAGTDEAGRKVVFSRVATSEVGGWRHGRLSFGAERLADVAAAISRATGTAVTVAPALADTPFTGSLRVHAARPAATIERIAALSGNRAVRDGDAWMIVPIDHASD